MKVVYKPKQDFSRYQFLVEVEDSVPSMHGLYGEVGNEWTPPKLKVDSSARKLAAGDFWNFGGPPLIASERAANALKPLMRDVGEVLPIPFDGGELFLLNITRVVDCIDQEKTDWKGDDEIHFKSPFFRVGKLADVPAFRVPECIPIVYVQENFKLAVEAHALEGLLFLEEWRQP